MASFLTTASTLMCPHGGSVSAVSSNTSANAASSAIVRSGDTFTIAGCAFFIGPSPHPCVKVQWIVPAARVKVAGDSALTESSVGLCLAADQAPQGPVQVVTTQSQAGGQ